MWLNENNWMFLVYVYIVAQQRNFRYMPVRGDMASALRFSD